MHSLAGLNTLKMDNYSYKYIHYLELDMFTPSLADCTHAIAGRLS